MVPLEFQLGSGFKLHKTLHCYLTPESYQIVQLTAKTASGKIARSSPVPLPLIDLFRNYRVEIQFSLLELKRLFEVFNSSPIIHAH